MGGISRRANWNTIVNKPTTVAGMGLSDFGSAAIAAQAGIALGAVGSYAVLFYPGSNLVAGDVYAGNTLRAQAMGRSADNVLWTPNATGVLQSGQWRCISDGASPYGVLGLFLKISD